MKLNKLATSLVAAAFISLSAQAETYDVAGIYCLYDSTNSMWAYMELKEGGFNVDIIGAASTSEASQANGSVGGTSSIDTVNQTMTLSGASVAAMNTTYDLTTCGYYAAYGNDWLYMQGTITRIMTTGGTYADGTTPSGTVTVSADYTKLCIDEANCGGSDVTTPEDDPTNDLTDTDAPPAIGVNQ